jgi:RNA 2',3'-cyclic 3'-phosphodiesterase
MMRAFLGVPVPPLEALRTVLEDLRGSGADYKLVRPDHFHLTLKFFGEVTQEFAQAFLKLYQDQELPGPFDLALRDVGAFPSWKRPNVLWAGVEDPAGGLARLHVAAERTGVGLGQASEGRGFSPHLTLARRRGDRAQAEAVAALREHRGLAFGTARVDRVHFYRSTLTPAGPEYDVVGAVSL